MKPSPGWRRLWPQRLDRSSAGASSSDGVDEEIRFHIEGLVEEAMAAGASEEEARALALQRFGDPQKIARDCARRPGVETARRRRRKDGSLLDALRLDLRQALRLVRRRPALTAAVLLTLMLGVGATTAVFSVVHAVLLAPPPHPDPDELVLVWEVDERPGFFEENNDVTIANFRDWQEQNHVFETMAYYQLGSATFRGTGDPERVSGLWVGAGFLEALGAQALVGRTFTPEEYENGNDNVVLLSHSFWTSRFGGDPAVVGTSVRIGSGSYPVVGVLEPGFRYLDQEPAILSPLVWSQEMEQNRRSHMIHVLARLRDGVSVEEAQRDMDRIVDGLRQAYPEYLTGWGALVEPLENELVGEMRPALVVLMGAVAFVLLVATVNVANLMLARAAGERRERALRAALGASRHRLLQQQILESLLLALGGGLLGLAVSAVGIRALLALAPEALPRVDRVGIDSQVVLFALLVSAATGLLFGLIAAAGSRIDGFGQGLHQGDRGSLVSRSETRLISGLVVAQLAFSLVLLVGAGLLASSFLRLMKVDPGFETARLLSLKITLPDDVYPGAAEQSAFLDRLLGELETLPGVAAAGATKFLPLLDHEWTWSVYIEGRERDESQKLDYGRHAVSPDYFRTMGIHLLHGRGLRRGDRADRPPVVVVNEAFVDRFFPDGSDPIGQRLSILGEEDRMLEIVGVVENVHHYSLDEEPLPLYYVPYSQIPVDFFLQQMSIVLRTAQEPTTLLPSVRATLSRLDDAVPISDVRTMQDRLHGSVARWRFALTLVGVFAGVALVLAVIGVYGMISNSIGRRVPEIGVRMALGAAPGDVARQVLAGGLRLAALGLLLGIPAALLTSRGLTSLLYRVPAYDPAIYGAIAVLLAVVALLATWLPARRASQVDPMVALRNE